MRSEWEESSENELFPDEFRPPRETWRARLARWFEATQTLEVNTGVKRCSTKAYFITYTGLMVLAALVTMLVITINNRVVASDTYVVNYYTDAYGDRMSPENVRTEDTKPMSRLWGMVTVQERIDWVLTLDYPELWIGVSPALALWVQVYNGTSHLLSHASGSPVALAPLERGSARVTIPQGAELSLVVTGKDSKSWVIVLTCPQ
jgi:hypothetical protein